MKFKPLQAGRNFQRRVGGGIGAPATGRRPNFLDDHRRRQEVDFGRADIDDSPRPCWWENQFVRPPAWRRRVAGRRNIRAKAVPSPLPKARQRNRLHPAIGAIVQRLLGNAENAVVRADPKVAAGHLPRWRRSKLFGNPSAVVILEKWPSLKRSKPAAVGADPQARHPRPDSGIARNRSKGRRSFGIVPAGHLAVGPGRRRACRTTSCHRGLRTIARTSGIFKPSFSPNHFTAPFS